MADRALTDLELERWLAAALPESRQRIATAADRQRLEELRAEHAALLGAVDVDAELRGIDARVRQGQREAQPVRPRRSIWAWALSGGALAAAAAVALLIVLRPAPDPGPDLQPKGDAVSFAMYAASGTGSRQLSTGDTVVPGDKVRFQVNVERRGYVAVVGIDGTGASTVYYPFGAGEATAIDPQSGGLLPGAVELDAASGDEHFYAVYAEQPFALGPELFAGLRAGRLPDRTIAEIVVHKKSSRF
jgi:hypothetical protein